LERRKKELTSEDLMEGKWRFAFHENPTLCLEVTFHPDGRLTGLPDERGNTWGFDGENKLFIVNSAASKVIQFDEVFIFAEEALIWGSYKEDPGAPGTTVWLQKITVAYSFLIRWTAYLMRGEVDRYGWDIGAYTYGLPTVHDERLSKLKIGRYCSIAQDVNIALGHHRTDTVSSYPFQTLNSWFQDWPGSPNVLDHGTNGDVEIGSDVWIATGVFIASGVKIGHGAVIAAQSVVTKDIPPYAIVGGNTARLLRYRFDEQTIERLLELKWWDWPAERVNRNLPLMISGDMPKFLAEHE
jgi:acetyltransferase-like isoleucine patch superfamily enzyme